MSDNTVHSGSPMSRPAGEDAAGYDPTTGTFHSRFDGDSATLVVAVVEAVATVTNSDLTAMAPLYNTVDPEALTEIMTADQSRPINVVFSYEGCQVTVSSDGAIVVEPQDD